MTPRKPPQGKALNADEYAERHDAAADFEDVCLLARRQHNLALLRDLQPGRVLEVSCGPMLLCTEARAQAASPSLWVIVEPAQRYADIARAAAAQQPGLHVVADYIEYAGPALQALGLAEASFDVVLASSLIHETAEPEALLRHSLRWLRPGGRLIVSVPNAQSFHRLLAVRMGLIDTPEALSDRNRLLGQPRVFGPQDLQALVADLGLVEERLDGYLFKPFTHAQMAELLPSLGANGVQGLIDLGRDFPLHAAEICIVARRP